MQQFSRPLHTASLVEDFLMNTLAMNLKEPGLKGIISKIVDGELGVIRFVTSHQTLSMPDMRDADYRDDSKRWALRAQIIDELNSITRLDDDEKIKLRKGGAQPISKARKERKAFIIIGLPASGKSSIANEIAEDHGGVILDSDYAKRKLPEFKNHLYGASIVHEESSQILFGFSGTKPGKIASLFELTTEQGKNLVIPRIGQNPETIITLTNWLKQRWSYEVHLILISISKQNATIRAIRRFAKSKRYVPIGLIFDGYGNDPSLCYYYLRSKYEAHFASFGAISTEEASPYCVDSKNDTPALKYPVKDITLQLP